MYFITNLLFRWKPLRNAIFAEVDWYNSITRTIQDPESMKTVSAIWCEEDGWRGWSVKEDGSYYFNDAPSKSFSELFENLHEGETV